MDGERNHCRLGVRSVLLYRSRKEYKCLVIVAWACIALSRERRRQSPSSVPTTHGLTWAVGGLLMLGCRLSLRACCSSVRERMQVELERYQAQGSRARVAVGEARVASGRRGHPAKDGLVVPSPPPRPPPCPKPALVSRVRAAVNLTYLGRLLHAAHNDSTGEQQRQCASSPGRQTPTHAGGLKEWRVRARGKGACERERNEREQICSHCSFIGIDQSGEQC